MAALRDEFTFGNMAHIHWVRARGRKIKKRGAQVLESQTGTAASAVLSRTNTSSIICSCAGWRFAFRLNAVSKSTRRSTYLYFLQELRRCIPANVRGLLDHIALTQSLIVLFAGARTLPQGRWDGHVHWLQSLVRLIVQQGPGVRSAVSATILFADDDSVDDRRAAVQILQDMRLHRDIRVVAAVCKLSDDESVDVRRVAVQILKDMCIHRDIRVVASLCKCLEDDDVNVCHRARDAMYEMPAPSVAILSVMLPGLQHDSPGVRCDILAILKSWVEVRRSTDYDSAGAFCDEVTSAASLCLTDHHPLVRKAAIGALAEAAKDNSEVALSVATCLADNVASVRDAVITTLAAIPEEGHAAFVPKVMDLLLHSNRSVRLSTAKALQGMGADYTSAITMLIACLDHRNVNLRCRTVSVMGVYANEGDTTVISAVSELLQDAEPRMRCAATETLGKIVGKGDRQVLCQVAEQLEDADRGVREVAIKSLGAMRGNVGAALAVSAYVHHSDLRVQKSSVTALANILKDGASYVIDAMRHPAAQPPHADHALRWRCFICSWMTLQRRNWSKTMVSGGAKTDRRYDSATGSMVPTVQKSEEVGRIPLSTASPDSLWTFVKSLPAAPFEPPECEAESPRAVLPCPSSEPAIDEWSDEWCSAEVQMPSPKMDRPSDIGAAVAAPDVTPQSSKLVSNAVVAQNPDLALLEWVQAQPSIKKLFVLRSVKALQAFLDEYEMDAVEWCLGLAYDIQQLIDDKASRGWEDVVAVRLGGDGEGADQALAFASAGQIKKQAAGIAKLTRTMGDEQRRLLQAVVAEYLARHLHQNIEPRNPRGNHAEFRETSKQHTSFFKKEKTGSSPSKKKKKTGCEAAEKDVFSDWEDRE